MSLAARKALALALVLHGTQGKPKHTPYTTIEATNGANALALVDLRIRSAKDSRGFGALRLAEKSNHHHHHHSSGD